MKIGHLINTHGDYLVPLQRLINSLCAGGVGCDDVFVVCGGRPETYAVPAPAVSYGCGVLMVPHDSWDYTGLIELVSWQDQLRFWRDHTHFFCLQDTMEFGLRSHELINGADPDKWATAAFGGQCNLVLYEKGYLLVMRDFILARRNNTKEQSIEHEGALWKGKIHAGSFPPGTHAVIGKGTPYGGAERIKEYYAGVDIVKWKANYGQNMNALITQP